MCTPDFVFLLSLFFCSVFIMYVYIFIYVFVLRTNFIHYIFVLCLIEHCFFLIVVQHYIHSTTTITITIHLLFKKKKHTVQIEIFITMQVQKMPSVINYLMQQAKEISILNLTIDPF